MTDVNDRLQRWAAVGRQIGDAREAQRPRRSKRAAAKIAGISDAHWRHIEAGKRLVSGVELPPAISPQVLEDAAASVGLDPRPLFEILGWDYTPTRQAPPPSPAGVAERVSRLEAEMAGIRASLNGLTEDVTRVLQRLGLEGAEDQ